MIKTERLNIHMASDDEMRALIAEQTVEELKIAYEQMLLRCKVRPKQRQWYAAWFIQLTTGEHIGELCFKGLLSNGKVEIGYGLLPEFCGKGYATEAVIAMVTWAFQQPGVKAVIAETDVNNLASQKVLTKAGFSHTGYSTDGLLWTCMGKTLERMP